MSFTIYILYGVAFLDLFAVGMIIPLVPNHVRQMGANHIIVGLLGSIYAGFQLGSGPLIGSLSDLKGRKSILLITLLLCSISYAFIGFTDSIIVILIIRALLGLFKQTQMLTKALVSDYEKESAKQSSIYGKMTAISGVGITTGPIVGGHIMEDLPEYGFKFIALLVGVCFLINTGVVYLLPHTVKSIKKNKNENSVKIFDTVTSSIEQSFLELYKINWTLYWDVFLFKGLLGFTMGVYYSNYALYLKSEYGLTPKYVGYVISFQGVVGSLSSYFIGAVNKLYTKDYDFSERNFHIFLLLVISLCGLIMSGSIYAYVFWLIPLAISNAIGRLVTLEMVLKRCDKDHIGTLIGAANSIRSLSGVISPMVAGFMGHYFGVPYVIYASLAATLIGAALSYQVKKNLRRPKVE